jgi:hypothetical protein
MNLEICPSELMVDGNFGIPSGRRDGEKDKREEV